MDNTDLQFKHSASCKANSAFAWSFWTDVSNWEKIEGDTVEWIRLEGDFQKGTKGMTKTPGQEPQHWTITDLVADEYATIDIELSGAILHNTMRFKSLADDHTLITQTMQLSGPEATEFVEGMNMLKRSAPAGLAKLAKAIEEVA
ncbi:MAG: hypothetical protein R8G66_16555 [Cytophagales bacterium]|nr:hypothetical protein [Cytophagales bacterium]